MKSIKLITALAIATTAALTLGACSNSGSGGGGDDSGDAAGTTLSMGYVAGWTDQESLTYLIKNQLEKLGYSIEVETLADNGPIFAATANGDLDIFASTWPDITHKSYMDEFGETLESLNVYYDNAKLTLAVPSYSSAYSIADLTGEGSTFNSEIIGVEPGAGLTRVTQEDAMPAYGLDDWTLRTSSTASMLTVLGEALENKEEIVVTLWRPFWANSAYDMRDLEDPEGAMGEAESLQTLAVEGFSEEHPDAAELIAGIQLDDDAYGALESLITSDEYLDDFEGAVAKWIEENPDAFPTLIP
ncbi:glycine betaine ABC transporter substrate-binding protein [Cryobacterium melibiosiphilum]|uniref:Glycine betaine ABC transporter substrate-binding protein n=1 Tax=Cryobacterium melibiosiphilum TaxID=995039 RepID=A0A3A5MRT1_9MICO|nr:glycine betaine ABC transporter substrate-binding protein [Cryobacterium melibiosiphilum]RJT89763.1 glycine betaine ABC transporter substrate-binding protein [Cryobacterium melibiosiphilum]